MRTEAHKENCTFSFEPVIGSGKDSSMPHSRATGKKLRKGFLVMDFGINYEGYMSDMTRTIYLGEPSKREIEIYNMLKKVQDDTIKQARPGMKVKKLMEYVIINLKRYSGNMIHGLGHGIGVEIHELPSIHMDSKDVFRQGDVFTVEPGVYFENRFGIRIEDDVIFVGGKPKVLTKSTKELIVKRKW